MSFSIYRKQHGAALIVSLIFLLILTILGVSSLSNSGLESRMAHNFQLSNYVFHGAESAIEDILATTTIESNPTYYEPNDPMISTMNGGIGTTETSTYNPDPNNHLGAATIATNNAVEFLGESYCPGTSIGAVICYRFEISSTATIAQTGATDTHRLGVQRMAPGNNL